MPRHRQSAPELLDIASDLVLKYGFAKTSMADIARAAGVSKGLLYLRFADRDALLAALLDREFALAVHVVETAVEADEHGGLLSRVYVHSLHALQERPLLMSLYTNQDADLGRFVRSVYPDRYQERLDAGRRYIERLAAEGMLRTDLDGVLTDVLSLFAFGLAATAPNPRVTELVRGVADLVALAVDADVRGTASGKRAFRRFAAELIATTEWSEE